MDAASDRAGGVRLLVKTEEGVVADALCGTEDIREGDLPEGTRDVSAALSAACNADESGAAQLSENAADDDGMYADAARKAFACGGLLISVELDADENVDGDGETARDLHIVPSVVLYLYHTGMRHKNQPNFPKPYRNGRNLR